MNRKRFTLATAIAAALGLTFCAAPAYANTVSARRKSETKLDFDETNVGRLRARTFEQAGAGILGIVDDNRTAWTTLPAKVKASGAIMAAKFKAMTATAAQVWARHTNGKRYSVLMTPAACTH